jgi:aryl-alcohol dehydrogenase-like predicted oxidoreductase/chlorite dismutase
MRHPTTTAFGIWSGGHFMHFGSDVGAERLENLVGYAYDQGVRTFMTADAYGQGSADELLGRALANYDRDSYCLVGAVGHDFYNSEREAERGYPRFTDPRLRGEDEYGDYIDMAVDRSLDRLGHDRFDLLLLHNPDATGYTHQGLWDALSAVRESGRSNLIGVAPGPANGFTLDIIDCFEKHGDRIDWAMIILNPLEPWPGNLCLDAAAKHDIKIIARVVDYGGIFHDDLKPGTRLPRSDHRAFRPPGWIEAAHEKLDPFREIADAHDLSLLQFACKWDLGQTAVESVAPTLLQEPRPDAKSIEQQIDELALVDDKDDLTIDELEAVRKLGDNTNCMALKGASTQYLGEPLGDQWQMTNELREVGKRWDIEPDRDLLYPADIRDIREKGAPRHGVPQTSTRRLYIQLLAFGDCRETAPLIDALEKSALETALYADANDPFGVALLLMAEDPSVLTDKARSFMASSPFADLTQKPHLTMLGRTYSSGREPNLEDYLLGKPRRNALNTDWPWAIWYPLRRKSEFALLPPAEQGKILMEHAMIGRTYGTSGYAHDIRLACYGLDEHDNEFVLGLVGPDLFPLSRIVQEMRKTQQTGKYMDSLGPFFVGKAIWQSPLKK